MHKGLLNYYYDKHVITDLREDVTWANQGKMEGAVRLVLELDFICGRTKEQRNVIS
jgi:hypothetical protein